MSEMATCITCGERFFAGYRMERPICGVCQPREPAIDWSTIPRHAPVWEGPPDSVAPGGVEKAGL